MLCLRDRFRKPPALVCCSQCCFCGYVRRCYYWIRSWLLEFACAICVFRPSRNSLELPGLSLSRVSLWGVCLVLEYLQGKKIINDVNMLGVHNEPFKELQCMIQLLLFYVKILCFARQSKLWQIFTKWSKNKQFLIDHQLLRNDSIMIPVKQYRVF